MLFAALAEIAFRRVEGYNTTAGAYRSLFYAAFGQFDFAVFEDSEFGQYFGIIFMVTFLSINIGLFMSLFIAMLTTLYEIFVGRAAIYHMVETLKVRPVVQADKEYSALISIPPPLNVILIFLAPFMLTSKNPEVWNKAILWVAYLPILIATTIVFIAYNFLLMPIAFVKVFFHKMVMIFIYSKSYRVNRADKFMLWIFFAIIGPIRLFLNCITDILAFLKHCVLSDLKKTKVSIRDHPLSKDALVMIVKYLKERNERMVPFKQVAAETRDHMGIFQKIRAFI